MGSQANGQALRGHNTNAPVDVAADRIEVQDRADRAIFSGDVIARQGDMTLSAARLTVAYSDAGGIQIDRLTASGGVLLRSPSETARGDYAIYDLNNRVITMLGGVTMTPGESRVNGARTEARRVGTECGSQCRSRGSPYPQNNNNQNNRN